MKEHNALTQCIVNTSLFVLFLWCIKSAEILFSLNMSGLGVYPLHWRGALGILTAPLVHGSLGHLFSNTLPLLILGSVLLYGYPRSRFRVLALIWLVSGLGVWLFARQANHIGASGLSHGIFFFLFVISILRRDKSSVAIMMIAFLMYGGMTMTIFPSEPGISFEYHFFGALAGTTAAFLWYKRDPKPIEKRYFWENREEPDDPVIGEQWRGEVASTESEEQDITPDTTEETPKRLH
ncbi:MAG: membrane associated rhomboid family serine protease [Paraglaciecola sp.]|jgi:membrane associated rhomboid family serine protease